MAQATLAILYPHRHALAVYRRVQRDTQIDEAPVDLDDRVTILWTAVFARIQSGQHLDMIGQAQTKIYRHGSLGIELSIQSYGHLHLIILTGEMYIAGMLPHRDRCDAIPNIWRFQIGQGEVFRIE